MSKHTREQIQKDVLLLLGKMSEDWEYGATITDDTRFIADFGLDSLEVVILSTVTQEHYDVEMPFGELFAAVGEKETPDLTVREWVDFVYGSLVAAELGEAS